MTALPAISVVVPTYRRPALLRRCLEALLAQDVGAGLYEVIVVDDGRDAATRAVVEEMAAAAGPALRYATAAPGRRGPAVARNAGWRAARGTIVAFTDDDTIPARRWLAAGAAALERHRDWLAAAGRVVVPRERGLHAPPTDHERMTLGLETAEFVTANAFVRRAALERVGGFDERFRRAWREDSDLQFRLQALGPVGRADDAIVLHPVRAERWGICLRQQRNVFFDALLCKKHPRLYRQRIRPVPPWDYYAIVALALAAPALFIGGRVLPGAAALTAALALVLRFALRRLRGADRSPAHVVEMCATSALIPFLSVYWRLRGALHFKVLFL